METGTPKRSEAARRMLSFELRRQHELAARRARRARHARDLAGPLAEHLRATYGVTRVLLFGSVATGTPSDAPDLDLAVEGLPPGRLGEALGDLLCRSTVLVDPVDLDRAPAHLRARILTEG